MQEASENIVIALDAMGGDAAPGAVILGADLALEEKPELSFIIFGDNEKISPVLSGLPKLKERSQVVHTSSFISADEKPSSALRQGKDSSMRMAIDAVKEGKAAAVVSSGNTGALMGMSMLVFRTLPGIVRPAIVSIFPTATGRCVFLDLGANVECGAENLVQFALMGDAFARVILGLDSPKIGLLNVGSEDMKGHDSLKAAAQMLNEREKHINFFGFIEGDDLAKGTVDVVVTDGFTGNVALKTAEGVAKMCTGFVKEAFSDSLLSKWGGFFARKAFKKVFKKLDPRLHNGAMLVGLNGITVKSHGCSDAVGNANAINVSYELVKNGINSKIIEEFSRHNNA